jgi:hypothetical protein
VGSGPGKGGGDDEELDGDEVLVLVGSIYISLRAGFPWYASLTRDASPRRRGSRAMRLLLGLLPVALLAVLAETLHLGAARDVREDADYIGLFLALGAAWLVATAWATALLGVSIRDDAIERNNLSAGLASAGALVGGMVIYAFANLGEGETIWTTIGPAALATGACFALWAGHQIVSGAADAIAIDRDTASGLRFAGMTIGTSIIVGRAVAGDYESAAGTFRDLWRQGWPALPLAMLAAVIHLALRPTKRHPRPGPVTRGLLPAIGYASIGLLDFLYFGPWISAGAQP